MLSKVYNKLFATLGMNQFSYACSLIRDAGVLNFCNVIEE